MAKQHISFTLNGAQTNVLAEPRERLMHVLREPLGQTESHIGCENSLCGARTVDMGGESVLRECLAGKDEGAHGKYLHHKHFFNWDVGDKDDTDRVFDSAEVTFEFEQTTLYVCCTGCQHTFANAPKAHLTQGAHA